MSRRRQTALLATGVITVAASLAACGSPITAYTNWTSIATLKATTHNGLTTVVLKGPLVDAQGAPIPNTVFAETCAQIGPVGEPAPAYRCLAAVNTGSRVYFASGAVAGPYGKLQSLATPATLGSITITNVSTTAGTSQTIAITAAKGLNGNSVRLAR